MDTQLRHDMRGATLLRGRMKITTKSDEVFRLYTTVNTTASAAMFDGYLRKFLPLGGSRTAYQDSRLRAGAGIRFRAGTGQYVRYLTIK